MVYCGRKRTPEVLRQFGWVVASHTDVFLGGSSVSCLGFSMICELFVLFVSFLGVWMFKKKKKRVVFSKISSLAWWFSSER